MEVWNGGRAHWWVTFWLLWVQAYAVVVVRRGKRGNAHGNRGSTRADRVTAALAWTAAGRTGHRLRWPAQRHSERA